MQRKINLPDYPRYFYARHRAYQILCRLEVNSLPVDPWKIAAHFSNIKILKWTELKENLNQDDPLHIDAEGADAKTKHRRGDTEYLVVYDDREANYRRVRWTIAHEIAHIMLGHLLEFEATALSRGSLTEKDYHTLEREADCFAANLLAPMTIIRRISRLTKKNELMKICDLSETACGHCMEEMRRIQSGETIRFPFKEEIVLYRQFYRFVKSANHEFLSSLGYDDVNVNEEYEDYIECDYWDFVIMAIGEWEHERELATAITGSLALYDDEDMVIYVIDEDDISFIQSAETTIVEAMTKYASSSVRRIAVKQAILC